jgi:hypothetical protein
MASYRGRDLCGEPTDFAEPRNADSELIVACEQLARYADGALGWLNALHDAIERDDVLVTTMPRNFGRPGLCQALADARRAIAAARGEGAR